MAGSGVERLLRADSLLGVHPQPGRQQARPVPPGGRRPLLRPKGIDTEVTLKVTLTNATPRQGRAPVRPPARTPTPRAPERLPRDPLGQRPGQAYGLSIDDSETYAVAGTDGPTRGRGPAAAATIRSRGRRWSASPCRRPRQRAGRALGPGAGDHLDRPRRHVARRRPVRDRLRRPLVRLWASVWDGRGIGLGRRSTVRHETSTLGLCRHRRRDARRAAPRTPRPIPG